MRTLPSWLKHFADLKILKKVAKFEYLRRWSLSEVVRLTFMDGNTIIAKVGRDTMSNELAIYNDLLIPFHLEVPTIYESYQDESVNIILMEDLGIKTVETEPKTYHFYEAARRLARIRLAASQYIKMNKGTGAFSKRYFVTQAQYLEDLDYLIRRLALQRSDWGLLLRRAKQILPGRLEKLYREYPVTLAHNDYHCKNLIIKGQQIVPIDWSNAYLSPHLGDLYCIIEEAKDYNVRRNNIVRTYRSEMEKNRMTNCKAYEWQIQIGGLCWEIRSLRWVLEFGISAIAEAKEWTPNFLSGIQTLCNQLES